MKKYVKSAKKLDGRHSKLNQALKSLAQSWLNHANLEIEISDDSERITFEDNSGNPVVLGIKIDEEANDCRGVERLITTEDSAIPCYVIPTNEELMIARDTYALYQEKEKEKELIENEII